MLVHFLGYIGAVVSLLLTTYAYSIPVIAKLIGKEYGVPARHVLPIRSVGKVFGVSALGAIVLVPNFFLHGVNGLVRLIAFGSLYVLTIGCLLILFRMVEKRAILAPLRRVLGRRQATDRGLPKGPDG